MKVRGMAEEAGHNFPGPKAAEFKEQNSALPGSGRRAADTHYKRALLLE